MAVKSKISPFGMLKQKLQRYSVKHNPKGEYIVMVKKNIRQNVTEYLKTHNQYDTNNDIISNRYYKNLVLVVVNSILLIVFLLFMLFWAEYVSIKAYIILGILIVFEIMYLFMYKNSRKNFKNMQKEGNTNELI